MKQQAVAIAVAVATAVVLTTVKKIDLYFLQIKLWYIPDDGLSCNLNECLKELHGHRRRVGYLEWHPIAENVLASAGFDYLVGYVYFLLIYLFF